jgi:hypothetical protein
MRIGSEPPLNFPLKPGHRRQKDGQIVNAQIVPATPHYIWIGNQPRFAGWSETILEINSNSEAPWNNGYDDIFDLKSHFGGLTNDVYRAMTLLHELGHVFEIHRRLSGSAIKPDGQGEPRGTSQSNTKEAHDKCFKNLGR